MKRRRPARGLLTLVPLLLPLLAAGCGTDSAAPRAVPPAVVIAAAGPPTAVTAGRTASAAPAAGGVQRSPVPSLSVRPKPVAPRAPAVLVLEFHDVVPAAVRAADPTLSADPYVVSTAQLMADLDFLRSQGFATLTPDQVAAFVAGRLVPPPRSVLLTFDDGLESFYEYALPALAARGMRATVFVIAGRVRPDNGPYRPIRLTYMSWPELGRAAATGLVTIGGHTYALHTQRVAHAILPGPPWRIAADMKRANVALAAHLGGAPDAFAYPFGLSSPAYVTALQQTGYRIAFVGGDQPVRRGDDPFRLPRFLIRPGSDLTPLLRYVGPAPVAPAASDRVRGRVETGTAACKPGTGANLVPCGMGASPPSAPRRPTG